MKFIDPDYIENRFERDLDFFQSVLTSFHKTKDDCLNQMQEGLAQKNSVLFGKSVHKLKGSTLNFTQSEIIQELAELEKNIFSSQISLENQSVVDDLKMKYKELCDELDLVADSWKEPSSPNQ